MNCARLYAVMQRAGVIGGITFVGAGFYAAITIGICRKFMGLSDNLSVCFIGFPVFIVLFIIFLKYLPAQLGKAGMLSEDPEEFGPWFK